MLKVMIVDDEQYAREELSSLLHELGNVDVVASCSNAIEALKKIHKLKPDILFLDIEMPQISGLDLINMLEMESMPKVVFVTAFEEYALQAFEKNAFDYILKPIEPQRLVKTLLRIEESNGSKDFSSLTGSPLTLIPCTGFNRYILLKPEDIEIAYSDQAGVHIICHKNKDEHSCALSLKILEEKTDLIRCHRQYLVNPNAISEIKLLDNALAEIITLNGSIVPVSRRYLKMLKAYFQISN